MEAAQDAHGTRQRGRCESTAGPGGLSRKSAVFCLLLLVSHSCCFVVGPNDIEDADVDFGDSSSDILPYYTQDNPAGECNPKPKGMENVWKMDG